MESPIRWLRNPAPVDRWFIPWFLGFQPSIYRDFPYFISYYSHKFPLFIGFQRFQPSKIGGAGFLPPTVPSVSQLGRGSGRQQRARGLRGLPAIPMGDLDGKNDDSWGFNWGWLGGYIYIYTHTYIHTACTYVHTYIRTYVHTYLHTYIHTYVRTYIHT